MFFVTLPHKERQVVWVGDLGAQGWVSDQFSTQVALVVSVLQLDDVARAHHVIHVFKRPLEHDGELDVLAFVHHGVAEEQVG